MFWWKTAAHTHTHTHWGNHIVVLRGEERRELSEQQWDVRIRSDTNRKQIFYFHTSVCLHRIQITHTVHVCVCVCVVECSIVLLWCCGSDVDTSLCLSLTHFPSLNGANSPLNDCRVTQSWHAEHVMNMWWRTCDESDEQKDVGDSC